MWGMSDKGGAPGRGKNMQDSILVSISAQPLDIAAAHSFAADPAHGAVDMFIGIVRDHHEGKNVTGITYDAHEALAEKALREICEEAQGMWPETRYYVAHYKGELAVGGISVLIAVGAPHRAETFDACRYVIEEIKKRAPVWKQEHYRDGKSAWLPGHSLAADAEIEAGVICCGKCRG